MGTTTLSTGLQHPDTTGANVTWATGYQANLTLIDNYLRGFMKRVDTDAFEAPQTGVIYYAPPPYNLFGAKAMAQRFTGASSTAETTLIASGVDYPIASIGHCLDTGVGVSVCQAWPDASYTWTIGNYTASGNLVLRRGAAMASAAGDAYDIIAFYVIL